MNGKVGEFLKCAKSRVHCDFIYSISVIKLVLRWKSFRRENRIKEHKCSYSKSTERVNTWPSFSYTSLRFASIRYNACKIANKNSKIRSVLFKSSCVGSFEGYFQCQAVSWFQYVKIVKIYLYERIFSYWRNFAIRYPFLRVDYSVGEFFAKSWLQNRWYMNSH